MKICILILVALFNAGPVAAQSGKKCNQSVRIESFAKELPKGYVILYVFSRHQSIDFNNDGYLDYVISVGKKSNTIGDTSYLMFYKMDKDSSYSLVNKFSNLYPVYFNPNDEHPVLANKTLQKLFDCYIVPNPLYSLKINNDTIVIMRRLDGHNFSKVKYTYKFMPKVNDWQLIDKAQYNQYNDDQDEIIKLEVKKNDLLSRFSYCEE